MIICARGCEVSGSVRFGEFEVNLRLGELRQNGAKLQLPAQSFQILAMLLNVGGEVVLRQDIQKRLWPNDTVVEFENSINAAIKRLRLALGDPANNPRYIETLARRGYRWIMPVEWIWAPTQSRHFANSDVGNSRDKVRHPSSPGRRLLTTACWRCSVAGAWESCTRLRI